MNHLKHLFLFLLVLSSVGPISGYADSSCDQVKPVVMVHGILADKSRMKPFVDKLKAICPKLYVLDAEVNTVWSGRLTTLGNLQFLLKRLKEEIHQRPQLKDGFHLIGQSLGGVLSRYYVQEQELPSEGKLASEGFRVHKLITWATPHRGVYGLPGQADHRSFGKLTAQVFWKLAYLPWFQKTSSIAELWNDPAHENEYLGNNLILPQLNNEVPHPKFHQYRENIKSLDEFVVFQSFKDEVIHPRESTAFDYFFSGYHEGPIQRYEDTIYFREDVLGIKSLAMSGRFRKEYADCAHRDFPMDPRVHDLTLEILGVNSSQLSVRPQDTEGDEVSMEQLVISDDGGARREVQEKEIIDSIEHFKEVQSILVRQKEYYEGHRPSQLPIIRYEKEIKLNQDRVDLLRTMIDG